MIGKNSKKIDMKAKTKKPNIRSFLPDSGIDIELSRSSKQKIKRRSDYKIRLKYSQNNRKRWVDYLFQDPYWFIVFLIYNLFLSIMWDDISSILQLETDGSNRKIVI